MRLLTYGLAALLALAPIAPARAVPSAIVPPTPPSSGGGGSGSASPPTSSPTLTSGAYTTQASDLGKVIAVTAGVANATVTLMSASTAGDGAVQQITKADAGSGIVQVFDNTSGTYNAASAWLITQGDVAFLRSNGSAWAVYRFKIAPWRQSVMASSNVIVPPLLTSLDLALFNGGSGGYSGQRAATSVARSGGTLGNAGGGIIRRIPAADILTAYPTGAGIPVTIGAGGAGGPAVTTDSTSGATGSAGGSSSFGTLLDTLSTAAFGYSNILAGRGGNGISAAAGSTASVAGSAGSPPIEILNSGFTQAQAGYGSGGTTSGTPPTAGMVAPARPQLGGSGGGSGAYISGQAGQAGAAGGPFGGGGGGGAPSDNGFASGAGGPGGSGGARITWNFGE